MKKEQKAIEILTKKVDSWKCKRPRNPIILKRLIDEIDTENNAIETVLNILKEKEAEIDKRDNVVRKIINRLDDDINRIAKSKQENTWDDYRRCRLKAYKTKTREIKEYIEEQYFKNKAKE